MSVRLVMNPFADLHIHPPPTELPIDLAAIEMITVKCPVRGRGLVVRDLTRDDGRDLFDFFLHLIEEEGELEIDASAPVALSLAAIGFLVPEDQIFEWPRFSVPLPEAPALAGAARWSVAHDVLFQGHFELHPGMTWPSDYDDQDGLLGCFAPGPALWVGGRGDVASAYWLDYEQAALVERFAPGQPAPPLPPALTAALASVGALVSAAPRPDPAARFAELAVGFADRGHAVARALLPAGELDALRSYYRALLDGDLVRLGDRQCERRYSSYNDPVGRYVHARLAPIVAAVAGFAVDPTFSYFFAYVDGAELEAHTDREQAELSVSLQLDYDPAPAPGQPTGWPLCLTVDGVVAEADLAVGDAVFYRGRELVHHRAALPAGHRSSHLVLEYVPTDFTGLRV